MMRNETRNEGNEKMNATQQVATLKATFASQATIPMDAGIKLIGILESAPDEALAILFNERVKFCWMIARRILRDRGHQI